MNRIILAALAWAAVIIGVALVGRADIIPQSSAETLTVVLPVLAVVSLGAMSRRRGCGACA